MPINEGAPRRSGLTKQQKREAEAAIYGLSTDDMESQQQFSVEDIERMRAVLAQHDAQAKPQGIKEFDLNAPPKAPYTHQEFPKMVYHHEKRQHRVVHSAKEEKAALAAGWKTEAYPREVEADVELDETDQAEAVRLDRIARQPKKEA